LLVSKVETKLEIEQVLPQIIQNFSSSGIDIKRVEVILTNNSEQYSLKEQSLQQDPFQQNSFKNPQVGDKTYEFYPQISIPEYRAAADRAIDAYSGLWTLGF